MLFLDGWDCLFVALLSLPDVRHSLVKATSGPGSLDIGILPTEKRITQLARLFHQFRVFGARRETVQ